MQRWKSRTASRVIPVIGLLLSSLVPFVPDMVEAAALGNAYIRLDRMMANTATGGTVCARAATAGLTEGRVAVTFPSTYTVNTTAANWTTSTTNLPAGAVAWPTIQASATSASSPANTVVWTSGNLPDNTNLYCFNFSGTNTLTTAGSAANSQQATVETQTGAGAALETTGVALANINNDQIVVTAVVPPTFLFSLSGNTDTFSGNLDPASVLSTAGRTVSITTNAKGGWIAWAKDSNQGLFSVSANYTIPTAGTINAAPNTLSSGTEGYVLDVDMTTDASGGCTVAVDAEYNGGSTSAGGTFSANFQPIAACTGAAPATSNGDVITLIERAAIAGATPAGSDYTDTITVVGAGNF